MAQIIRCTRCILPSTLSMISFDDKGVCNHCRKYESDFKDWELIKDKRKNELERLFDKARRLRRPYDVLVPLSGGKDSTYALYLCTKVYGLKTLAVTFDNGFLTQPARDNIMNALSVTNADHLFYTINKKNSSELFKVVTERTGDFCSACMRGINYSIEFALQNFNIPLVIKGSGRRVQYVSQIKEISGLNTPSYMSNVLKGTSTKRKFNFLLSGRNRLELQKIVGGLADLFKMKRTFLMRFFPQHIGMYDYIYLPFNEIVEILKSRMNWNDYKGFIEHLDCSLHDIPFYKDTLRIGGITRHTFRNSGLIRQGLMTREEALRIEEEELKESTPPNELFDFLKDNNIDYQDYLNIVKTSDNSSFEPRLQKLAREIYHKFRKY